MLGGLTGLAGILVVIWCGLRGWAKDVQRAVFQPVGVAVFAMTALWLGAERAIAAASAAAATAAASCNGPNTDARDQLSPDRHIWLAPHGRSIHKYMTSPDNRLSGQRWGTFVRNHLPQIAAMDLFVVPTISFNLLYVLVIVRLARRELVWINVTAQPTAEWIAQQITEAFPWNEAPRYLIRDRDGIYGAAVTRRLRAMGIRDKPISAGSPWQNCFAERLIGTIRRECLDHVVALGEHHLRRVLKSYADYYNRTRTHRSLNKDAPISRPVQSIGCIVSHALVGGLHHRYARI